MVNLVTNNIRPVMFGNAAAEEKEGKEVKAEDKLLLEESKKHPITLPLKIQADKFAKACTDYPVKGFKGSKNANFYQFLTMGMVPYLIGSVTMAGVFNLASKFFDTPAAKSAAKLGNKMGLGVILYGVGKTLSKKFVEKPVKAKYNIDVNLPYEKIIHLLPEKDNKGNLTAKEYHKVFESVDFPSWDRMYNETDPEKSRNAYYDDVAKRFGLTSGDEKLEYSDQKVKPLMKKKIIQTKVFSTLSSYLWAATGVAVALQKPWENLIFNPVTRAKNLKNYMALAKDAKEAGVNIAKYKGFVQEFGSKFVKSCKELVSGGSKASKIAGRTLVGSALAATLIGNFVTLKNVNKDKGRNSSAATKLFDQSKEKVVC